MVRIISHVLLVLFCAFNAVAQQLESQRTTNWALAGIKHDLSYSGPTLDMLQLGADPTGSISCNAAYQLALETLSGQKGTIYFPAGEYFFDQAIAIPDSIMLKGESSATTLRFDLGGNGNLIVVSGNASGATIPVMQPVIKGSYAITVADASTLEIGDLIRLSANDEDLMYSDWAYGTLGQILQITQKTGNTLFFDDPINHSLALSREPQVTAIEPRRGISIECLRIERLDASSSQTSNIYFRYATDCVVRNVESFSCNFTHVELNASAHITIEGSYFHHAFAYGGGGQGYGVVFQETSSFNLAQNNVFEHLRHSMLLQSGANGNVFAYNYSFDPFWVSGFLPSNAAGDMVLHGNYPYLNLFEGNVGQNIVVDASHGSNGPYNTFYRNRAQLYGFFSDSGTPTDSMNIIGNEITLSGWPYGLFSVNGNGHFVYGNNVSGTVTPAQTTDMGSSSLFLTQESAADLGISHFPLIGYPNALGTFSIPADERFQIGLPIQCSPAVVTDIRTTRTTRTERPLQLFGNTLVADEDILPADVRIFSIDGRPIGELHLTRTRTELDLLYANGLYLIALKRGEPGTAIRVLITR